MLASVVARRAANEHHLLIWRDDLASNSVCYTQETEYNQELLQKAGPAYAAAVASFIHRHGNEDSGCHWLASMPTQTLASARQSFVVQHFCPAAHQALRSIACVPVLKANGTRSVHCALHCFAKGR